MASFGTFNGSRVDNSVQPVGKGERADFMSRDVLKDVANAAIKDGLPRNKVTKTSPKKISIQITEAGFDFVEGGSTYLSIPAMAFHCLVMGKNSTWSRKQMGW